MYLLDITVEKREADSSTVTEAQIEGLFSCIYLWGGRKFDAGNRSSVITEPVITAVMSASEVTTALFVRIWISYVQNEMKHSFIADKRLDTSWKIQMCFQLCC